MSFFQNAGKSPDLLRFGRATHHSIENVSYFPTHTHMSSPEDPCTFHLRKTVPPSSAVLDRSSLIGLIFKPQITGIRPWYLLVNYLPPSFPQTGKFWRWGTPDILLPPLRFRDFRRQGGGNKGEYQCYFFINMQTSDYSDTREMKFFVTRNFDISTKPLKNCIIRIFVDVSKVRLNTFDM